jgi:hypothetical protein
MRQLQASRVCQLENKKGNRMRLGKKIYNLQRKRNKKQSNGVMLEMMMNKMEIDLNVRSSFIRN